MSRLWSCALSALMIAASARIAVADDVLWAQLTELTKKKGVAVNFKRAGEVFGLPNNYNEYPSYQAPFDESDGTAHHFTVYEDASKAVHVIVTSFDKESEAYRLGHAFLVSPKGELAAALEGLDIKDRVAGGIGGRWLWAQIAISKATRSFETEVGYWKKKIHQLETEPDRAAGAGWEQKCEKGTCRWWNGREKKWAE
jgi:hypothetical protein